MIQSMKTLCNPLLLFFVLMLAPAYGGEAPRVEINLKQYLKIDSFDGMTLRPNKNFPGMESNSAKFVLTPEEVATFNNLMTDCYLCGGITTGVTHIIIADYKGKRVKFALYGTPEIVFIRVRNGDGLEMDFIAHEKLARFLQKILGIKVGKEPFYEMPYDAPPLGAEKGIDVLPYVK